MSALYAGLYLAVFISYRWAPLLLVALTPFALALCGAKKGLPALAIVGVASALLWFFGNLFFATYNWVAVLALAILHAGIIVACGASLRWWYRATRLPLALLLPITFVAGEFLRLLGPLGVPTGLLALSFHPHLWMIQIADLGGIYLVSFAIASVNGALADVVLGGWNRARFSVAAVAAGWIAIACYGAFRLHESQQTMQPGPVIGVVQSDIPMTGGIEHGFDSHLFLKEMLALSDQSAASRPPPQLIVWPEAMPAVPPLNREWLQAPNPDAALLVASQEFERALRDWTTRAGIPLVVGTEAVVPQRDNPKAAELRNSAIRFDPGLGQNAQRQDKQRLFPLGETIPFRGTFIHTLLERSVASHSSVPAGTGFTPGEQRHVFELPAPAATRPAAPLHHLDVHRALLRRKLRHVFAKRARRKGRGFFREHFERRDFPAQSRPGVARQHVGVPRRGSARRHRAKLQHRYLRFRETDRRNVWRSRQRARPILDGIGRPRTAADRRAGKIPPRTCAPRLATDPALAAHVTSEIAAIEELRRAAGVSGQSTQRVYVDSRRTLYSRIGDVFPWALVIFTGAGLLALFGQKARRALRRRA